MQSLNLNCLFKLPNWAGLSQLLVLTGVVDWYDMPNVFELLRHYNISQNNDIIKWSINFLNRFDHLSIDYDLINLSIGRKLDELIIKFEFWQWFCSIDFNQIEDQLWYWNTIPKSKVDFEVGGARFYVFSFLR